MLLPHLNGHILSAFLISDFLVFVCVWNPLIQTNTLCKAVSAYLPANDCSVRHFPVRFQESLLFSSIVFSLQGGGHIDADDDK